MIEKTFKEYKKKVLRSNALLKEYNELEPQYELIKELIKYRVDHNITQQQLANCIGVTRVRINEIVLGKRAITPDTAFRLAKYFNTTPDFWINLQVNVDMWDTFQSHKKEYENINTLVANNN